MSSSGAPLRPAPPSHCLPRAEPSAPASSPCHPGVQSPSPCHHSACLNPQPCCYAGDTSVSKAPTPVSSQYPVSYPLGHPVSFIPCVLSFSPLCHSRRPIPALSSQPQCHTGAILFSLPAPRTSPRTMRTGGSAYSEPCAAPVGAHRERLPAASRSGRQSVLEEAKAVRRAGGGRAVLMGRALGRGPGPSRLSASVQTRKGGDFVAWGQGDLNPLGLAMEAGRSHGGEEGEGEKQLKGSVMMVLFCCGVQQRQRETAGAVLKESRLKIKLGRKALLGMRHNRGGGRDVTALIGTILL